MAHGKFQRAPSSSSIVDELDQPIPGLVLPGEEASEEDIENIESPDRFFLGMRHDRERPWQDPRDAKRIRESSLEDEIDNIEIGASPLSLGETMMQLSLFASSSNQSLRAVAILVREIVSHGPDVWLDSRQVLQRAANKCAQELDYHPPLPRPEQLLMAMFRSATIANTGQVVLDPSKL